MERNAPTYEFLVTRQAQAERLDKYLATMLKQYSRARIQEWINQQAVHLNGRPTRPKQKLQADDIIHVWVQPTPEELADKPQDMPLDVVYESEQLLVVNKPAGLVTHPGAGNWSGTLLNALLFHYPELVHLERAGIVHRLDKDTSGLLMVARTPSAQAHLGQQLKNRSVQRAYRALCVGVLPTEGRIQIPVIRDPRVAVRMAARDVPGARDARTDFRRLRTGLIDEQHRVSEVECMLHTGRTHQIRVHLGSQSHPILGDGLYGGLTTAQTPRQMLHAHALAFNEPETGRELFFECPPPQDYRALCAHIMWDNEERQ